MLVLVVVLAGAFLVLTFVEPNSVTITRSILIKAPKEAVFEQMVNFKNWPNWSPFYELDTAAKYTYGGTDGTEGSYYSWDSKKTDVGSGAMMNTGVKGTRYEYHIDFSTPRKGTATGYFQATDSAGMTKATWSMTMPLPFPMNALQVFPFCNLNKILGASFEHGLDKMKKYAESHPGETTMDIEIKEVDYPAHMFQGVRKVIPMSDIMKFCSETYDTVKKVAGAKITGAAVGIYYTWDTATRSTDMFAGYPVSDTATAADGLTFGYVDASKAYMSVLKGGYSHEMIIHMALAKYAAAKGGVHPLVLEEYVSGPKNEPDSNKWVTNIYYLVK